MKEVLQDHILEKKDVSWSVEKAQVSFDFTGTGFVLKGETAPWASQSTYVFNTELYIDDQLVESIPLPASYTTRRYEICWKYDLPKGKHRVLLKLLNPSPDKMFKPGEAIIYSDKPVQGMRISSENITASIME
jgi:hypothetical protein